MDPVGEQAFDWYMDKYFEEIQANQNTEISDTSSNSDTDSIDEWRMLSRELDSSDSEDEIHQDEIVRIPDPPLEIVAPLRIDAQPKLSSTALKSKLVLDIQPQKQKKERPAGRKRPAEKKPKIRHHTKKSKKSANQTNFNVDARLERHSVEPTVQPIRIKRIQTSSNQDEWQTEQSDEQQRNFECGVCKRTFKKFTDRLLHLRQKHISSQEHLEATKAHKMMRTCQICEQVFLSITLLKKHEAHHKPTIPMTDKKEYSKGPEIDSNAAKRDEYKKEDQDLQQSDSKRVDDSGIVSDSSEDHEFNPQLPKKRLKINRVFMTSSDSSQSSAHDSNGSTSGSPDGSDFKVVDGKLIDDSDSLMADKDKNETINLTFESDNHSSRSKIYWELPATSCSSESDDSRAGRTTQKST